MNRGELEPGVRENNTENTENNTENTENNTNIVAAASKTNEQRWKFVSVSCISSVSTASTPSVSKLQSLQEVCKVAVNAPLSAADIFMRNKGVFSRHVSGQYWQGDRQSFQMEIF